LISFVKLSVFNNPIKPERAAYALILNIRYLLKERTVYSSVAENAISILIMICPGIRPVFIPSERIIPKM